MITLFLWFAKIVILMPLYAVYLAFKVVFFPISWLLKKPKEEKEIWIWF